MASENRPGSGRVREHYASEIRQQEVAAKKSSVIAHKKIKDLINPITSIMLLGVPSQLCVVSTIWALVLKQWCAHRPC